VAHALSAATEDSFPTTAPAVQALRVPLTLAELVAYHRLEAAKFASSEPDNSERYGSKYIVGVVAWHGQLRPAVLNTETGLTSDAMSRTLAQRRCQSLNFLEFTKSEGAGVGVDSDDAKLLRKLHGVAP